MMLYVRASTFKY